MHGCMNKLFLNWLYSDKVLSKTSRNSIQVWNDDGFCSRRLRVSDDDGNINDCSYLHIQYLIHTCIICVGFKAKLYCWQISKGKSDVESTLATKQKWITDCGCILHGISLSLASRWRAYRAILMKARRKNAKVEGVGVFVLTKMTLLSWHGWWLCTAVLAHKSCECWYMTKITRQVSTNGIDSSCTRNVKVG